MELVTRRRFSRSTMGTSARGQDEGDKAQSVEERRRRRRKSRRRRRKKRSNQGTYEGRGEWVGLEVGGGLKRSEGERDYTLVKY